MRVRRGPLLASVLAAGTAALYAQTAGFGFLNWDDGMNVVDNLRGARGFSWDALRWWWTAFHGGHYMPLAWASYAVDFALWGLNPAGYHLANAALHAVNAVLVFLLLRRAAAGDAPPAPLADAAAALAAAWWAWHPARVESVAWVSQRRDLLAGCLLLSSALCYVRRRAGAAFAFYAAALFAKAISGVFPAALLVLDRAILGRKDPWPVLVREKLTYAAAGAAVLATAALAQAHGGAVVSFHDHPWPQRLVQAGYGAADYGLRTVLPLTPRLVQEFPADVLSFPYVLPALAAAAAGAWLFFARRRAPGAAAAAAWFLIFLSPTLGFLQSGPQFTASRYTYLAAAGPAAWLAGALSSGRRPWAWAAAALLASLGAGQTLRRLPAWRDGETFWRAACAASPGSALAWTNLGDELIRRGRPEEALAALDRAVGAARNGRALAGAEVNRGYVFLQAGRFADSMAASRRALAADPSNVEARNNLGLALLGAGRVDEAVAALAALARDKPDFGEGRVNLGLALARSGNAGAAESEFRAGVEIDPMHAAARYNLSLILAATGRRAEAEAARAEARRLDPRLPPLSD